MQQLTTKHSPPGSTPGPHFAPPRLVSFRRGSTHWMAESGLINELFDVDGLRLDEWCRQHRAETIKDGPHRTVYRLDLSSGRYYLKHYKTPDFRAQLQNVVRPCKSILEWRAARDVMGLAIPTFQTVALGQNASGPFVTDNFLLTREIHDVESLHDYVLKQMDRPPLGCQTLIRQQIAVRFGELVARLHAGRLIHRDLHPGNVLIHVDDNQRVSLWLVDLHAVGRQRTIDLKSIERNLSLPAHFFARLATRSDRLRFFRSYWSTLQNVSPETVGRREFRTMARRIEDVSRQSTLHALRKGDQKWLRPNRRQLVLDRQNHLCRSVAEFGSRQLQELRDHPEQTLSDALHGDWFAHGPRRRAATVDLLLDGEPVECNVIEDEIPRRHPERAKTSETSPLYQAWLAGHALRRRSLRAPVPVAFVQTTTSSGPKEYLATRRLHGFGPISKLFRKPAASRSAQNDCERVELFIDRLANELAWMHESGVDHQGLTCESILFERNQTRPTLLYTNLEQITLCEGVSNRRVIAAFARLSDSAEGILALRVTHRLRLVKRYLAYRRESDWKSLWQQVASHTQNFPRRDA